MSTEIETRGRVRKPWELLGLLGFATLFLLPALKTGYYAEDLIHSMTPGIARFHGYSAPGLFRHFLQSNLRQGRFYPVTQLLHVGVHTMARDVVAYKALLVAGTVLDVMLFYLLVRRLTQSGGFACFASCVSVALIQFRIHPDPVLGYYLQVQLVAAGLFFSLLALLLHLEGRGKAWLGLSCASYLLITLTYEVTYPFFLIHLLLIWRGRAGWKGRIVASAPILCVVAACALMTIVIRRMFRDENYYVHNLDTGVIPYLKAVWHQISATFPLIYLFADPHSVFPGLRGVPGYVAWALRPGAIAVGAVALAVAYRALRRPGNCDGDGARPAWSVSSLGVGLLLVVLPTLLIALSPFHREQFHVGVGWVPVLIQCHGMGLLIASGGWWLASRRPLGGPFAAWKCVGLAGVVAAVAAMTYRANVEVAGCLNASWGTSHYRAQSSIHGGHSDDNRRLLQSALTAGVADPVPENSLVLVDREYRIWGDPISSLYFYAAYASKILVAAVPSAHDPSSQASEILRQFLAARSITVRGGAPYRLRDHCDSRRSGYVVLWRSGRGDEGDFRLFVQHPHLFRDDASPAFRIVDGFAPEPRGEDAGNPAKDLVLVRSGRDWGLFSLPPEKRRGDPGSLRIDFDPEQVARR